MTPDAPNPDGPAPVMMQQTKGRETLQAQPWPVSPHF
jgi:hypothetical protein